MPYNFWEIPTETFVTNRSIEITFQKRRTIEMRIGTRKKTITRMKQTLTECPCLASYVKDKDNKITTNSSTTGLGITLWQKQNDGKIEPTAYRREFSEHSGKKKSIGEIKLLAVDWWLEKFYVYWKKLNLHTDHQEFEMLMKRNRCDKQRSARLTRWLDRSAHFDIAIKQYKIIEAAIWSLPATSVKIR